MFWRRALMLRERAFGAEHVTVAAVLNQLGVNALQLNQRDVAEQALRRALAIREKVLGANTLDTAEAASNLGLVLHAKGDQANALVLLRHAAAVTHVALGGSNPLTQSRWSYLSQVERAAAKTGDKTSGKDTQPEKKSVAQPEEKKSRWPF